MSFLMAEGSHTATELPLSAEAIGVLALVAFMVLLGITFAFRNVGSRH